MKNRQLNELIKLGNAPVIVDVRSVWEYQLSHVPGAIHIPFWATLFSDKLKDCQKTGSLLIYCEHGPRAVVAWLILKGKGFKKSHLLAGHMRGWKKADLPVECGE